MNFPEDLRYSSEHEWVRGRRRPRRDRHHRLRAGRARRRRVRAAARRRARRSIAGASVRRDRVDQVGVGRLRAGHRARSSRSTTRSTTRPSCSTTTPTATGWIFEVELADPAELDALLDAAAYRGPGGGLIPRLAGTWSTISAVRATRRGRWPPTSRCSTQVAGAARPGCGCTAGTRPRSSLGRFQPEADVDVGRVPRGWGWKWCADPPGGRALLHGGDLTYAVALRPGPGQPRRRDLRHLAGGLRAGLARLGVTAEIATPRGPARPRCASPTQQGADLRVGDRKLCGSAQVQRGGRRPPARLDPARPPAFDETDLVVGGARPGARCRLRHGHPGRLGAPARPRVVAARGARGFVAALDLDFTSPPVAHPRRQAKGEERGIVAARCGFGTLVGDAVPTVWPSQRGRCQLLLVVRRLSPATSDETTLSLAALEDRQALEDEFGAHLDELPAGVGHAGRATGPERRVVLHARPHGDVARSPSRLRHLPRRHHRLASPRRDRRAATAATRCATSDRSTAPTSTASGSTRRALRDGDELQIGGSCSRSFARPGRRRREP